ncbi:putative ribonuclease H-like domain-containing protein [Tanacetum coccineum]
MLAIDGAGFDWSYMADVEVPTNMALMFQLPKFEGLLEIKTSKNICRDTSNEVRESPDSPMIEKLMSDDKLEKKTIFPTVAKIQFVRAKQQEKPVRKPVKYAEMYMSQVLPVLANAITQYEKGWNIVPRAVLMKTGLRPLNTARPVNTAHPKTTVYSARPMSCFSKSAQSTVKRPYQTRTTLTNKNFSQKVNTAKGNFYTARPKAVNTARLNLAVVNAVRANQVNVVKASACWVWRPTKLNSASITLKKHNYVIATSNAFRIYNIRTRKVEESLHIRFLEDKPIIAGDGPKWLFDINVLTKIMNYCAVVADGLLFDSSSKNASNDEPQPSSDARKKDDEGVSQESRIDDQERLENSSQDVNTTRPSINTASTNVNTGSLNINTVSPTVTTVPLEATHADFFGDETELDMSNITTTYLVPTTPNTRIHKDHSLDHVIGDVQSAIGTKWVYRNKKDERGIVIRNKARLVTQGYTQEERIDYDEVFALVARIEAIRLFLAYASFKDFVVYQMDVKSAFLYGKIEEEVYVCQPLGFKDPEFPNRVYKVEKALYSLHQAPRACQDKYVDEILKKFGFSTVKTASTPMETSKPLLKDAEAEDVDSRQSHRGTLTEDKEIELWVELKILFEPDAENLVELQKYLHDPEMVDIWICVAVHHVSIVNRIRYIYAALKRIIHDNGTYNLDVMYKLRVDQQLGSIKRQKIEYEKEKEELKAYLDLVPREEFAMEIESLGTSEMLDDFDKQDVMDLHRLVEERYATSRPEGYDMMLWGDLKILFQPDEEDEVWRHQHEYNLISWRLFDSCRIHILLMDNGIAIHMMIENKYPQEMLSKMLSRKLEVDYENEMVFELLRFIRSKVQK